jgi:hypothetical protein
MNTSTTRNAWLRLGLLSSLCSLCLCGSSLAADAKEAYRLRVVLHVARHRLLTDVFRTQVARELGDGLRAALGNLARVEVVDRHPHLRDVLARGLGRALDSWKERSEVKTHFVLVDFSGGYYSIQARQHDGLTGLSGPVVRRDRTRDRAFVAKVAALLVEKDLGLFGTVASEPDRQGRVQVELRGGGLGVPLGRWVKKGSIFALFNVPAGGPGRKEDWALLRVEEPPKEGEGTCTATLFRRYRLARASGLACVQLGTVRAPLRLRLREERPDGRLTNLEGLVTLEIRRHGFEGEEADLLTERTDRADVDTSRRGERGLFDGVAFVTVKSGDDKTRALVPIPVVGDRLIVLPVPPTSEEEGRARVRLAALQRSVEDAYDVQVALFREINELTARPEQRARAIASVRKALERSRADRDRLTRERNDVAKELEKVRDADRPSLGPVDSRLEQLKKGEEDLQRHVGELVRIEKEESDPNKKKWLAEIVRAKALEEQAEVTKALELYERVQKEGYKDPGGKLAKHVDRLKKQWAPKNEEHKDARDFIYNEWPRLDNAGLKANLPRAEKMFKVCREAHDVFGPRKLLKGTEAHAVRLARELAALHPDVNIDDQKPAELIKEIIPGLKKLADSLRAYLEKARPAD